MWREGYDYPADDEDEGRDYFDEADEQHDKQQDEQLNDKWHEIRRNHTHNAYKR